MMPITLQAVPRQETEFYADSQQYDIRIWWDGQDMMFMDISINGTTVASACPCLTGAMVIPYEYLEGDGGNFFWSTASGENPQYANFDSTDVLLYATNAEMATARATIIADAQTIVLATNQAN